MFNGANVNENINITANHGRVKLTRDVGNVTMDLNGIEHIDFNALGGADNITVGDLTGTGVTQVAIDLAATPGSGVGDGAADSVTVNGTAGNDNIQVSGTGGSVTVTGLPATVTLAGAEGANDQLIVDGGAGNDVINAAGLAAGVIGSRSMAAPATTPSPAAQGNDMLIGGDGNDTVIGGRGNDVAFLGNGNDTFIWNPGDGSDMVEGQAGTDTLVFNGANVNENIDISANGSRVRLFRDVGNVTMDLNGIEHIQLATLGGADTVTVNDLTGTDVKQVAIDLSATPGSGQGDGVSGHRDRQWHGRRRPHQRRQQRLVGRRQRTGGAGDDQAAPTPASTRSSSTAAPATTSSTLPGFMPARSTSRSTAATAMTPSPAAPATTSSSAGAATTWPRSVPATTPSSGIPATAATRSTAARATTRCCSTAPTSTRTSTSRPMAGGRGSPATSATSP